MFRKWPVLYAVTFIVTMWTIGAYPGTIHRASDPIKGEYLVMLRNVGSSEVDLIARGLVQSHQGRLIVTYKNGAKGFAASLSEAEAERLADHPLVGRVDENASVEASTYTLRDFGSSDTYWHLDRIDQRSPIGSYKAYAYTSTGAGVNVYVLDAGIQKGHQEFAAGQVRTGANETVRPDGTFADGNSPDNACGGFGPNFSAGAHGTAVASLIAGQYTGVAPGATLIPVMIRTCAGRSDLIWANWGLDWILGDIGSDLNCPVVNGVRTCRRAVVNWSGGTRTVSETDSANRCQMIFGEPPSAVFCLPFTENNIVNLIMANVPVVVAANNYNDSAFQHSPARMGYGGENVYLVPGVYRTITVGATNKGDSRWVCPPTEPCNADAPGSAYGACVSIWAPGYDMNVTSLAGPTLYETDPILRSGTSYATAVTTGVVARLLEKYPYLSARGVFDMLVGSGTTVTSPIDAGSPYGNKLLYISPFD